MKPKAFLKSTKQKYFCLLFLVCFRSVCKMEMSSTVSNSRLKPLIPIALSPLCSAQSVSLPARTMAYNFESVGVTIMPLYLVVLSRESALKMS